MKKVLLVDDQVDIQAIVADCLRNYGIKVDAYANGKQASEKLEKDAFDLIITDLNMPEEDGFSFIYKAQNVFKNSKDTPIVVITGGARSFDFEANLEDLKDNNVAVLRKPFTKDQLLGTVCDAFGVEVSEVEKLAAL